MFDTDKYVLVVCVSCAVECAGLWSDTVLTNSVQSSVQLSTITEFSDPEYQYLDQHKNANTSLPFCFSRQMQFCFRSNPIPNATCDLGSVKFKIVNVITCILSHLV